MRVGKRLFPYPTINNAKLYSTFKQANYALEYEEADDGESLILKDAHIEINNHQIEKLLEHKKATAVVVVECSATIFRKTYPISQIPNDIKIPLNELRDKVVISSFIYATEDLLFYSEDFLEEYEDYSFHLEKYDIVAIDDGYITKVEYDEEKDKKLASIFSIIKSEEANLQVMRIEESDKKILIFLPPHQFDCYDRMKNNDNFQDIFFAIITIPALMYCLQKIQSTKMSIDEIKINYSWFESITMAYQKNHHRELDDKLFADMNVSILAQELMNYASVNAIQDIFENSFKNAMFGGEEDE